jgi:hypothetical protein
MAISTYEKDGKKLWSVYVNLRSKSDPKLLERFLKAYGGIKAKSFYERVKGFAVNI